MQCEILKVKKEKMKLYNLNKKELVLYCKELGFETKNKTRNDLMANIEEFNNKEIIDAKNSGTDKELLYRQIESLADQYVANLSLKIESRKEEMESDDTSHYLIYRVLGISNKEGELIDVYQNTGRFLYKYAGSFLEEATVLCFKFNNINGKRTLVKNTLGQRPKTFEIDFLDNNNAIEIKWRDATTDGDHITKEHTRIDVIKSYGYKPIRVMFYYPQREQAIRIQSTLKTLYLGIGGEYHAGDEAWRFVKKETGYDLLKLLTKIADKRTN